MLKRLLIISSLAACVCSASADNYDVLDGYDDGYHYTIRDTVEMLRPIAPTYLKDVVSAGGWRGNWFISFTAGMSSFAGNPSGCESFFQRVQPVINLSVGKWFTPIIGTRVVFNGWQYHDCMMQQRKYQSYHADLLWNVNTRSKKTGKNPRWDIVPYVGLGIINTPKGDLQQGCQQGCCNHNGSSHHPFAFSYGLLTRYRIDKRLHLAMEIGGTTTFRDFDGVGEASKLGDNIFNLSAGLSYTIGKCGFRKVVDARPYMKQIDFLMAHTLKLSEANSKLETKVGDDARIMAELKKILEIEGLLEEYGDIFKGMNLPDVSLSYRKGNGNSPRNNYSGLNSLRRRIGRLNGYDKAADPSHPTYVPYAAKKRQHNWDDDEEDDDDFKRKDWSLDYEDTPRYAGSEATNWDDYLADLMKGEACIGAPIYIFFRLGSTTMTEPSQLVNLDEIARIAKAYNLRIEVKGAADSDTGSEATNKALSTKRAQCIADLLTARGIPRNSITLRSEGGINIYTPTQANRFVTVSLFANKE